MNINILGISELKGTGMGKFNLNLLRWARNRVALTVNKSPKLSTISKTEWSLFVSKASHSISQ